jgi:hypothetical protein
MKKRRKPDVLSNTCDSLSLGNHLFTFDGEQEYVLVPPEHTNEQDDSAIIWPTFDVPQAPRATYSFLFQGYEISRRAGGPVSGSGSIWSAVSRGDKTKLRSGRRL